MAEFFVAKTADGENGHLVHDKDCGAIAPVDAFKYLGSFASQEAAYKKAKGFFYAVSYCPSCLAKESAEVATTESAAA